MVFGRKRSNRDFFKSSIEDRRRTEDERPWFLEESTDDLLDLEAGRSANDDELRAATASMSPIPAHQPEFGDIGDGEDGPTDR